MAEEKIRYFEFRDDQSDKFWQISWNGGKSFTVRYGKVSTDGRTSTKTFASSGEAKAAANKLMNAKHAKGYEYVPEGPEELLSTSEASGMIQQIFRDYEQWCQDKYSVADEAEEDEDMIWSRPLNGLKPLTQQQLAQLEDNFGVLPQSYRDLVLHIGVGTLLIATTGGPVEFTILPPKHIPRVKKDCLVCIDEDLLHAAKSRQGIDGNKLLPILVDRDWNQWALLANQSDGDDRVVLFSHEQEQREDADLFAHQGTVEEYFGELFTNARKLYSPWYMWTRWRH